MKTFMKDMFHGLSDVNRNAIFIKELNGYAAVTNG